MHVEEDNADCAYAIFCLLFSSLVLDLCYFMKEFINIIVFININGETGAKVRKIYNFSI